MTRSSKVKTSRPQSRTKSQPTGLSNEAIIRNSPSKLIAKPVIGKPNHRRDASQTESYQNSFELKSSADRSKTQEQRIHTIDQLNGQEYAEEMADLDKYMFDWKFFTL